ncbi:unnamed protein product [Larinioides sclopetarius]|uniref:Uncharacterized protein n=1 Tax=Larinioides sclopetarius TaxID=280406 RepID=A0AAV1YVV7_9ARAC
MEAAHPRPSAVFDGPSTAPQLLGGISNNNNNRKLEVRDYSGLYLVKLVPCTVTDDVEYSNPPQCNPRDPVSFDLHVRFQQVSDPVPAEYSLNTHLHLMRKRDLWLSNGSMGFGEDSDASFVPGDTVYGRVMMDPTQNLGESFFVNVEKCFLCTGVDGYVPKYDPERNEYGCVADSVNLLYAFKIIDKGAPRSVTKEFRSVPFNAILATDDPDSEVQLLRSQPNADGFRFDSTPLFQVSYGRQWFVHCIYTVRSKEKSTRGIGKRSITQSLPRVQRSVLDADEVGFDGRGTNMNRLVLNYSERKRDFKRHPEQQRPPKTAADSSAVVVTLGIVGSLLIIAITILFLTKRERRTDSHLPSHAPTIINAATGQSRIMSSRHYSTADDHTEV